MRLFIRADANNHIGIGHIMRCISLAQSWRKKGGKVTFISGSKIDKINQLISKEGFDFININKSFPNSSDIRDTLQIINKLSKNNSWVVTDGYHFSPEYHKYIRNNGNKLLVIDDVGKYKYKHANVILNQEPNDYFFKNKYSKNSILLLGINFILIRNEFLEYSKSKSISKKCKNILISMGGTDPNRVTSKILASLESSRHNLNFKIMLGLNIKQIDHIKSMSTKYYKSLEILEYSENMPEIMEWADLAITNGGTTTWELAYMGTPFITIAVADNQINTTNIIDKLNIGKSLGWHLDISKDKYKNTIESLIASDYMRSKYAKSGLNKIDGSGGDKIVDILLSYNRI